MFDRYVAVDWSASSRPKRGRDSIWIAVLGQNGSATTENPATRRAAEAVVREMLRQAVEDRHRVLVGFDFPYAYPRGYASALGLGGTPWSAVWRHLTDRIEDDERNANNRFQVADEINSRLAYPVFWGCPHGKRFEHLSPKKDRVIYRSERPRGLGEWREVEAVLHARGQHPQATWKLYGNGSVGGQSLTGIPVLARLRNDPMLASASSVWPFEVGIPDCPEGDPAIVHAEIWPSLRTIPHVAGQVKDETQVMFLAEEYRSRDRAGTLWSMFGAASSSVALEEGWILGVE
jgi:hypothetical protein